MSTIRIQHLAMVLLGLCAASEAQALTTGTGPRGGSYAAGPRGAVAEGPRGGVVATGPRGTAVRGPGGNAAVVGSNGGVVVRGPEGNVAYGARPGYPAYPVYPVARPPVAVVRPVPVYPGYGTTGAVAAGVAVGAVAGAAVASGYRPPAPPPGLALMPVGAQYSTLPLGCVTQSGPSGTLFVCAGTWLQPYMEGTKVVYVVIPAP